MPKQPKSEEYLPGPEIGKAYKEVLPKSHRQALHDAVDSLMDEIITALSEVDRFESTPLDNYLTQLLPPRYKLKYDAMFCWRFFIALTTVAWKLGQDHLWLGPSSVAEEMATWLIIQDAEAILTDHWGKKADFDAFIDAYFEDLDFQFLYQDEMDGIEGSETGKMMGIVGLRFGEWFERFGSPDSETRTDVHPYLRPDPRELA